MINELIEVFISGITNGSVYAVMAIGMALVYGVTKVFNFAYGSFYSMGGYMAWVVFGAKLGYPLVFIIVIPALFIAGWLTERHAIKPLRKRPDWEMMAVMVTLGLALFLDNFYQAIFGPFVKSLPILMQGQIEAGGFVFGLGVSEAPQNIAVLPHVGFDLQGVCHLLGLWCLTKRHFLTVENRPGAEIIDHVAGHRVLGSIVEGHRS